VTEDVIAAVAILQRACLSSKGQESYWAERYEFALDDLLRTPGRLGPPAHLVRNALSNASKKQARRQEVAAITQLPHGRTGQDGVEQAGVEPSTSDELEHLAVEIADCLNRASLRHPDRQVLALLMRGGTAGEVAARRGISLSLARVQVTRTQHRAGAAWQAA
jgi:DNA-directed RNA polymerase specialized sigma24 family protein